MHFLENTPDLANKVLDALRGIPDPSVDAGKPTELLKRCPVASETPLVSSPELAEKAGVGRVFLKDERARMELGSFKSLGAAYVIASDALAGRATDQTYVTASAGNHGLSVAAGARAFGTSAVIYLAETVPEDFADRLRDLGARVQRAGKVYEESMAQAEADAGQNGWALLSDSSWNGYVDRPRILMEGYTVLMREAADQMPEAPTHIFLQAGVGGLASACAAYARHAWGKAPRISVVEPDAAPAIFASMKDGSPQLTEGPVSEMGRLDCKEPSLIALRGLAQDADGFMTISETEGQKGHQACIEAGLPSTPSGAAGVAGLLAAATRGKSLGLNEDSRVLVILSEGPVQ